MQNMEWAKDSLFCVVETFHSTENLINQDAIRRKKNATFRV